MSTHILTCSMNDRVSRLVIFKARQKLSQKAHTQRRINASFSSGKAKAATPSSGGVSRKERRMLERQQRNRERREQSILLKKKGQAEIATQTTRWSLSSQRNFNHLRSHLWPKVPGMNIPFDRQRLSSLGYRLPFCLALCYGLTNDDITPYSIEGSIGPSMLPTIQSFGDIWLVETWAFQRMFGRRPSFQVGDIVLFKHPDTGRVSCKRIIGLEGDEIQRFGQYFYLYSDRKDFGVVSSNTKDQNQTQQHLSLQSLKESPSSTFNVPADHVWLEGDCPLFSLDSRQYGPIPISWLSGRLIYRVWPLHRDDEHGESIPRRISRDRPQPCRTIDQYLGKKSNLHRLPKK